MRIVCRNAACQFRAKYPAIREPGADIYVILECENPATTAHSGEAQGEESHPTFVHR